MNVETGPDDGASLRRIAEGDAAAAVRAADAAAARVMRLASGLPLDADLPASLAFLIPAGTNDDR